MPIRYHLDECVDPAVGIGLRQRGVDVSIAREERLLGVPDATQLAAARDDDRILVTHDRDFLRLAAAGEPHTGIAYVPPQILSIGEMISRLMVLWREREPESFVNQIEFL